MPTITASRAGQSRCALLSFAVAAAALMCAGAPAQAITLPTGFSEQTLVAGLTAPTALAWTPDGRMLVAEKPGRLKVVQPGATTATTVLDITSTVHNFGDRGLLGIAVDSQFATNRFVYLLYTYELRPLAPDQNFEMVSRLSRITLNPDNSVGPQAILLGSYASGVCPAASNTVDCIPSEYDSHSIGTVVADPDGTLWVGNGDGASYNAVDNRALRSYDEQSLAGKILHIDRNGRGLSGHPFCPSNSDLDHVCTKLHAKGLRNPFRFTARPSGGLAVGDVGWGSFEEIDLVRSGGRNYGWPCYEAASRTPGYSALSACAAEYAKEGTAGASTPPDHAYAHVGSSAVVGGPEYTGTGYPSAYRGSIFFGDYARGFLRRLVLDGSGNVASVQNFATAWYGVDLKLAPDGNLAYTSFGDGSAGSGAVRKILYTTGNRPPVAGASGSPLTGSTPLNVSFSPSGSFDPDGDSLTYDWDFGDGTPHSSASNPSHTYTTAGTFTARLTVSDGRGESASATVVVTAGNSAPLPVIESPVDGALYRDGDTVSLRGSATDPEDGTLPGSSLSWYVVLHHDDHIHPRADFQGEAGFFPAGDDHDADSYLEIQLTARDSAGLTRTVTAFARPETVPFTLDSVPAGAPLSYAGYAKTAPTTSQSAIGFRTSVSAAEEFVSGGRRYRFDRWSDGGARLHDITIPGIASTLTAIYVDAGPEPTPGLVAAYSFDESSGSAIVDRSGRGNSGTIVNAVRAATGKYGGALSFNGTNARVTVPDSASLDLSTGMTLEAWVRPATTSGWRTAILKEAPPDDLAYALYAATDKPAPGSWIGASSSVVGASGLPLNTWSHLATTYDGSTWRLYVNGAQVATRAFTAPIPQSGGALGIGGNAVWSEWFSGLIDEVRIFDRARTAEQILADRDAPIEPSGPDTTRPSVSVTAPASGAALRGSVSVTADASDDVGVSGVQFRLDGVDLGAEDTTAPYAVSWDTVAAADGAHSLSAIARDAAGNVTSATAVPVTVDNTPPVVGFTAPVVGATVSGLVGIAADAAGAASVQFRVDGTPLGAADTTAPYAVSWDSTTVANGAHTLAAVARDAVGNTVTVTRSITVSNAPPTDSTRPSVSVTAPASGAALRGSVSVTADASDDVGVSGVQFRLDGVDLGAEDTTAPYAVSWDTVAAADGAHSLSAIARDAAGNVTSATAVPVTVDNTPPQIAITAPSQGATVSGSVAVNASASDNASIAGVQLRLDGSPLGAEDTTAPYGVTWDTATATNGAHTLTAVARDTAGNTTAAAVVNVAVSNVTTGLVAAYSFNAGAGTTAADSSGLGNTGTLNGPTWSAAGRTGAALSFDGVNDMVTVNDANSLDLTSGMTLEAWVRPTSVVDWRTVILKETTNNLAYALYAGTSTAALSPPGSWIAASSVVAPANLAVGTWSHLAVTYDRVTWRLYVNGTQVASRSQSPAIPTSTRPLRIGGNAVWGEWFSGVIDDVRIFDRARSATQIQADRDTPVAP